jgi:hypothetical protein
MKLTRSTLTVAASLSLAVISLSLLAPKTVHALAATLVQVANTSTNPVISQDVDSPGRIPYYQTAYCSNLGGNVCAANFNAVPANTRLVVQYISSGIDTATPLLSASFNLPGNISIPILHTLQSTDSQGNRFYVASQPMTYYYEPNTAPYYLEVAQPGSNASIAGNVTLVGYYVNLTQ